MEGTGDVACVGAGATVIGGACECVEICVGGAGVCGVGIVGVIGGAKGRSGEDGDLAGSDPSGTRIGLVEG